MLREEVFREWTNLKQKMISFQAATLCPAEMAFLEDLAGKLFIGVLPHFPNNYSWSFLESYQAAAQVEKEELANQLVNLESALGHEVNGDLQLLQLAHSNKLAMYVQLVANWKDAGSSGPTIEEID